jgi:hypothetical protein
MEMDAPLTLPQESQLTDVIGLRSCGIFPAGKEPSIRTLREWTKLRRIPYHRVGHFVYYPAAVDAHIRTKSTVPARSASPRCTPNQKSEACFREVRK